MICVVTGLCAVRQHHEPQAIVASRSHNVCSSFAEGIVEIANESLRSVIGKLVNI
jgi:hypothetical protein